MFGEFVSVHCDIAKDVLLIACKGNRKTTVSVGVV